jgi:hypothetical protein
MLTSQVCPNIELQEFQIANFYSKLCLKYKQADAQLHILANILFRDLILSYAQHKLNIANFLLSQGQ